MKVAVITGASRGIGACVAEGLAADGYTLALTARSKRNLESVAKRIERKASKKALSVITYPLDVKDDQAIKKMIADVVSKFGRIDLLFNNAGIGLTGSLDMSIEEFDEIVAVNLRGAYSFLKAVVPIMKKQHSGMIINMASNAGKIGYAGWGAYGASKFGLVGLSESLYRELSAKGIKVTALCPNWVDTDMAKISGLSADEMISPEDILKAVRWLLSLSPAAVIKDLLIECRCALD